MDITIRKWQLSDYAAIAGLFSQVHQLHQANRSDIYSDSDTPFSEDTFTNILGNPQNIPLLAEVDMEVVGLSLLTLRAPSKNPLLLPQKVAYMDVLAVHAKHRKLGIEKKLFEAARREALATGYDRLELMVWCFNAPAIDFYKKLRMTERSIIMEMDL